MKSDFNIIYPDAQLEKGYETGLVVTTYNRPQYLARTLKSLKRSQLTNTIVLLVDDGSTDQRTLQQLEEFEGKKIPVVKAYRKKKNGCLMYENLKWGWDFLLKNYHCKYLLNLDPDAIVTKNWLIRLQAVYEQLSSEYKHFVLTGFNAYQHPLIEQRDNYYRKASAGGINFLFDGETYTEVVRPVLIDLQWDDHVVASLHEIGGALICTRPSVVQHIGRSGLWSSWNSATFDFAIDFGDAHPVKMKIRLIYFRLSKKVIQKLSRYYRMLGKLITSNPRKV